MLRHRSRIFQIHPIINTLLGATGAVDSMLTELVQLPFFCSLPLDARLHNTTSSGGRLLMVPR
jgi:hypothetical protein